MSETTTQRTEVIVPEYIEQPTEALANTLQELMRQQRTVPQRQVVGFTPTQQAAFQQAFGGIGSFQPFLDAAQAAQTAGLGTIGAGAQTVAGADFGPGAGRAFMDPYQQAVTQEALKEVDRQAAMAQNQLAGQAVKAGAFGGSRFGIQQSELARNAQDLKSRRIFEDLSRNFQQAQQTAQQSFESQQGRQFNVGQQLAALGGQQAGLGQLQQGLYGQDVAQLQQAGALSQQQRQNVFDAQRATQQLASQEPFQRLSFASGILTGTPASQMAVQQQPSTSPLMQVAGLGIMGLGAYKGLNIGNPIG